MKMLIALMYSHWYTESADNLAVPDQFNDDWRSTDAKIRGVEDHGQSFRESQVNIAVFPDALQRVLEEIDRENEFIAIKDEITALLEMYEIELPPIPQRNRMRSILRAGNRSSTPDYAMLKADGDNMGKYVLNRQHRASKHIRIFPTKWRNSLPKFLLLQRNIMDFVSTWVAMIC
jgi:hypothetical protein